MTFGRIEKVKAILWDNDGVLVDTEKLYYQANVEVLKSVGFVLTPEMYLKHFLKESSGVWHLLQAAHGLADSEIRELRKKRDERHMELLHSGELEMPGVPELVAKLAQHYRMGIVTSAEQDSFDLIHSRVGLLHYFDFVVTPGDYKESKPNPEPYLVGIKRSGCAAEDCIAVEDTERGLIAASAAGLRCWIVASELTHGSDFSQAEGILQSPAELATLLLP